jgi:hypothetical protein
MINCATRPTSNAAYVLRKCVTLYAKLGFEYHTSLEEYSDGDEQNQDSKEVGSIRT